MDVDGPMAASEDRLVVASKGEVRALVAATGAVAWNDRTGPLTAPPLVHGEWVFIASGEQLASYRLVDGTKSWTRDIGLVEQRPAAQDARVYVPAADGRLVALDLSSGNPLWEQDVGIKPGEPLVYGDRVFVGSAAKRFCSLRAQNGTEDWCFLVGAAVIGGSAADASHVYFVALDNLLRAHDRSNGALRWKQDLHYRPSAGPSLVGQSVSAPGPSRRLQAFSAATGVLTAELTLPDVPVFIVYAGAGPTKLAAITGGLQNLWTLSLAGPPPPALPSPRVAPVTELPGLVIPPGAPPVPPGSPPRAGGPLRRSAQGSAPRTTAG